MIWVDNREGIRVVPGYKSGQHRHGGVYVVLCRATRFYKIGWAKYPPDRIKTVAREIRHPVELIARFPGTRLSEHRIHHQFASDRMAGEWFWPSKDILAFVEATRGRKDARLT
jgi:hypothetical protein